jgi:hypothetical protein
MRQIRKRTRTAVASGDAFIQNNQTKQVMVNIGSSYKLEASDVIRGPVDNIPIPSLTFKVPGPKQVLNLAALAASRRLRLAF